MFHRIGLSSAPNSLNLYLLICNPLLLMEFYNIRHISNVLSPLHSVDPMVHVSDPHNKTLHTKIISTLFLNFNLILLHVSSFPLLLKAIFYLTKSTHDFSVFQSMDLLFNIIYNPLIICICR